MKRSIWQRVIALVVSVLIAFPAAFITLAQTASAASRPFTLRYSADLTGDIVFAANTILTCPTSTTCSNVQTGSTAGINNNYSMVYVDADADSSTFNSSASSLNLPTGSTVTFAGLYWGAVSSASAASSVKFKVPGATTYTTVTASSFDTIGSVYSAFANVTTSVAAAGNGTFWAADIRATQGSGSHGGWALVVQYSYPGSKTRNCSIFDGLDSVGSGSPKSVNVSGFRTPPAGTVATKLGVIAYEGDRGTTGDALSLNGTVMSDAVNPANDFFNSSLTNGGSHVTGNAPGYLNNLGFDADILNVANPGNVVLANNATSAKIDLTSTGDVYYPAVVTFCTELYAPQIVSSKSGVDTSPTTPLLAGDQIRYTIDVRNVGQDPAIQTVLTDNIPSWTTFVPGSLSIVSGPNAGPVTDALGDDRGEFSGSAVRVRIGNGATSSVGGTIPDSQSAVGPGFTSVTFLVRVNSGAPDGLPITNAATIGYKGFTLQATSAASSSTAAVAVSNVADLSVTKTNSRTTGIAGNAVSYVVTYTNRSSTIDVANAVIEDQIPSAILDPTWTCVGLACPAASGTGSLSGNLSLPALASVTYTVSGTVSPSYTGTITNTATITAPGGTTDPDQLNNTATDVDTITAVGDLSITKSNGVTAVRPGQTVSWTISVSNSGPSTVVGATVTDTFPASVRSANWTCSATVGSSCATSGSGSLNTPVTLAAGGVVTFVVNATLDPTFSGSLVNTASVRPPTGFTDSNLTNNSATDLDSVSRVSDLAITKSHTPSPIVPGQPVVWTISVDNLGPSVAATASVTDTLPAGFVVASASSSTWSCTNTVATVSCSANDLAVGTSTIVITSASSSSVIGVVTNSAIASTPSDPDLSNNTAIDSSVASPNADLQISKSHSPAVLAAGTVGTWTVQLMNNGPSIAQNVVITDAFPAGVTVTSVSASQPGWLCSHSPLQVVTCAASSVAVGESTSFTITGDIGANVPAGTLSNTASVVTTTPQNTSNDSATDVATVVAQADLGISKARIGTLTAGAAITYSVTVFNNGPADVVGAGVADVIPAELTGASWTCAATGTGLCPPIGVGDVNASVSLKSGERAVFTISATALPTASGTVRNTATVSVPAGITDPNLENNDAVDTTNASIRTALSIAKTNDAVDVTPGTVTRYVLRVRNDGPSTATGAAVTDTLPAAISSATWTCSATAGSCGVSSGTGSINTTVNLSPAGVATFVVLATVSPTATGTLSNTATVAAPPGATDPDPSDNSATDADTLTPYADISISKTDGKSTAVSGDAHSYTIVVSNSGPSTAAGVRVTDALPSSLTNVTWSCVASTGSSCSAASGSGSGIDETVQLAPSGNATYTVTGTIHPGARGVLRNTVEAVVPAGTIDPSPLDLTATDETTLTPVADVSVTKTGSPSSGVPGNAIVYTLTVSNSGPSSATGVTVSDPIPMGIASATWTCTASSGSTCTDGSGTNSISSSVDLAPGGSVEFTITAMIDARARGTVTNIAGATLPSDVTDPTPGANEARVVTPLTPTADVSIVKSSPSGPAGVRAGEVLRYEIVVSNAGPSAAPGTAVADALDSLLLNPTWTCAADAGSTCPSSGVGNIATTVDLAPTGSVTFQVVGTADPATAATSTSNTATATVENGVVDPTSGNNTSTAVVPVTRFGDLSVEKTAVTAVAVPGRPFEWTIVATNSGPSTLVGARIVDTLPAGLENANWSCQVSAGSSCASGGGGGDIDTTVDLISGGTATFTIIADIGQWLGSAATVTLENTVRATTPPGFVDPNSANNTATASTPLAPSADVELSKTNSQSTTIPGTSTTYVITAFNHGPSAVRSLTISDLLPPPLVSAGATWNCKTAFAIPGACHTTSGTGVVVAQVDLAANDSAVITVTVPVLAAASGTLTNTATAALATYTADPDPSNNVAVDVDTLTPTADLSITKTDGVSSATPGSALTYSIVVRNSGPSDAPGTVVRDTLPSSLAGGTWTCTASLQASCASTSGSGSIDTVVDLRVGGSATFLMTATVASAATGTVANTATVTPAASVSDPDPANNSATDTDTLTPVADVSITKTDNASTHVPGRPVTYEIVASNTGPSDAPATHIIDTLPSYLSNPRWTCRATNGAVCPTASGSSEIDSYVGLPSGSSVTYSLTVDVDPAASGNQVNTAQALVGSGITDPNPANNTAVDTNLLTPAADLTVSKVHSPSELVPGAFVDYTIVVRNSGPSAAPGVDIDDPLPAPLQNATWTCVGTASATCSTPSGVGSPLLQANLPVNGSVTVSIRARISEYATGTLSNTVFARLPSSVIDPTPDTTPGAILGTTRGTDSTVLQPRVDLSIAKTDGVTSATPGDPHSYTITVQNGGPSAVRSVRVRDVLPTTLINTTWSCRTTTAAVCSQTSGTGDIDTLVDLPANTSVTFSLNSTLDQSATGTLRNSASLDVPAGAIDSSSSDDQSIDVDTLVPSADLVVTKTRSPEVVVPGRPVTYSIVVKNNGPSSAPATSIADALPSTLTDATWTCTGRGGAVCSDTAGTGSIATRADLPAGSSATYVLVATLDPAATATLTNTASATPGPGVGDPSPSDASSTNATLPVPEAALSIEKTHTPASLVPGSAVRYTVVATNDGPSDAPGTGIVDNLPAGLVGATWTCSASVRARCDANSGTGSINSTADLRAGGSVTYTIDATIASTATGNLANSASLSVPSGVTDTTSGDNSSTDTAALVPTADLSISKSHSPSVLVPGLSVSYSLVVTNNGPSTVTGARVLDRVPIAVSNVSWTCSSTSGAVCGVGSSGAGDLDALVDLAPGSTTTFRSTGTVSSSATGIITNTGTVFTPSGVTDPDPANNTADDNPATNPTGDIAVTKSVVSGTPIPGEDVVYDITVVNRGPSDTPAVRVVDSLPAAITGATWTCATTGQATCGQTSGTGSVDVSVNMPAGSTVRFLVRGRIDEATTGELSNRAFATLPPGITNASPDDDSSSVTSALVAHADLSIAKRHLPVTLVPGEGVTYLITVANAGPSTATDVDVVDVLPSALRGAVWTCAPDPGSQCSELTGMGDLRTKAVIGSRGKVVYTVRAQIDSGSTGNIVNTARLVAPPSLVDPAPGDHVASDIASTQPQADLVVTKSDFGTDAVPGTRIIYTISVSNLGPSDSPATRITDPMPSSLSGVTWTCVADARSTCSQVNGTGSIDTTLMLPVNGVVTILVSADIDEAVTGTLSNSATATNGVGVVDPDTTNNVAVDRDALVPTADLVIEKSDNNPSTAPGLPITYTIVVTNNGPSTDPAVVITDNPPPGMRDPVWTCAQCAETSGTGPIATTAALRSRQSITLIYSGVVDSSSVGTLTNEATVTPSAGVRDLNGSNNLSADIDTLRPTSNIEITKSHVGPLVAGRPVSYDIRVINNGPSVANGVRVLDPLPEGLTNAVWSCRGPGARACETTEGTGSVDTRTNLAVGDVVMISLRADVNRNFVGTLTNTVRAFQPGTVIDPTPNNVGVDSAPVGVETNLRVRKRVQTEAVVEGLPITYEIIVENNGPSDAVGVVVRDVLPEGVLNAVWTCAAGPSAVCTSNSGAVPSNGVLTSVNLPNTTSATFLVTGVVGPVATITNNAVVSVGNTASDPDLSDNQDQVTSKVQLVIREIVPVAEDTTSTTLPAGGTVNSTPSTTVKEPIARVTDESNTVVEPAGAAPRSGVEDRNAVGAGDQGRSNDGRVAARNANQDSPLGLAFTGFQIANFVVALLAIAAGACLVGLADPRFLGRRGRRRRS